MISEDNCNVTYQSMLRAVGALLDEEPTCRITLTEGPEGFIVRLQRALHKLEPQVFNFKRETMADQIERLMSERSRRQTRLLHQGVWAHLPNGHQDFLRALGYELDVAQARDILLDELEDGIVLTYTTRDESTMEWRRLMIRMRLPEMEEILNAAFERRGRGSNL